MKDQFDKLCDTVSKMDNRLDEIEKTLVAQHESIKHHIYRTTISEKRLERIEEEMKPVKKHVAHVEGALKFMGILSILLSVIFGFYRFFI